MSSNAIDNDGLISLVEALSYNHVLSTLAIAFNLYTMPGLTRLFSLLNKDSHIVNLSFSVPIFTRQNDYQEFGNLLLTNLSSPLQIAKSNAHDSGNEEDSDEESKISIERINLQH